MLGDMLNPTPYRDNSNGAVFSQTNLPSDGAILAAGLPLGIVVGLIAGLIAAAAIWAVGLLLIAAFWLAWVLVLNPARCAIRGTWVAIQVGREAKPGHRKAAFMTAWKRVPGVVWEVCFAEDLRKVWHRISCTAIPFWRRVRLGAKVVAAPFIGLARLGGLMKPAAPSMVYIKGLGRVPARI